MDKVLICLEVPSISRIYEVYVPDFLPVREVIRLLVRALRELSGDVYVSSGSELLCSRTGDFLLDENATLSAYDIRDGDHLMLT